MADTGDIGGVGFGPVLAALAAPSRVGLVRLLEDRQLCVRDLVAATGMAQPLVSHHLKVLREAGLVESTVCSGRTVYRLRADTLGAMAGRLDDMARRAAVTAGTPPC